LKLPWIVQMAIAGFVRGYAKRPHMTPVLLLGDRKDLLRDPVDLHADLGGKSLSVRNLCEYSAELVKKTPGVTQTVLMYQTVGVMYDDDHEEADRILREAKDDPEQAEQAIDIAVISYEWFRPTCERLAWIGQLTDAPGDTKRVGPFYSKEVTVMPGQTVGEFLFPGLTGLTS
jgi:hypothetical protein